MKKLGIILLLISILIIVGPVGAVVVMYHNNIVQLVDPPQANSLIKANSAPLIPTNTASSSSSSGNSSNDNSPLAGISTPVFVGAQIDNASRTFTVTVNYTNTFNYDLTLNNFTANAVIADNNNYPLGSISLASPVTIPAGQTCEVTVSGFWTLDAQNYIAANYPGANSVNVDLVNATANVNGLTIQDNQPISVGSVPIN